MSRMVKRIFAAALMLCMVACAAQAQTVMLACGYEYEIPEGVTIENEAWTPENKDVVYYMDGTYNSGAGEFALAIYHADGFGRNMNGAIKTVQKKTGSKNLPLNTEIANKWGICVDIKGGVPQEKLAEWINEPAGFAFDFMMYEQEYGLAGMGDALENSAVNSAAQSAEEAKTDEPAEESAQQVLRTAVVNTKSSPLSLRSTPEQTGAVIRDIAKGETVSVLEEGEWTLIEYQGQQGYVNGKYLK